MDGEVEVAEVGAVGLEEVGLDAGGGGAEDGGKLVEADGFAGELAGGTTTLNHGFDDLVGELFGRGQGEDGAGGVGVWGHGDGGALAWETSSGVSRMDEAWAARIMG